MSENMIRPSDDAGRFFAGAIATIVLLFALMAFGLTMGSGDLDIFSSEETTFTEVNPTWEPAEQSARVGFTGGDVVFNASEPATSYTYLSQIYSPGAEVRPGQLAVNSSLGGGTTTIYVFTSNDGFASIAESNRYRAEDGLSYTNLTFEDAESFRFLVRNTGDTSSDVVVHDLNVSGAEYRKGVDLGGPAFIAGWFTLLAMFLITLLHLIG